jgi:hypothetical protein
MDETRKANMGSEHRDPLEILLSREKYRLRAQKVKVSLQSDGLELHIKIKTAECISIAESIQQAGSLPQQLRIIAGHLEATEEIESE